MYISVYIAGMEVVSGQKRGNQTQIITLTHSNMTLDLAQT